MIWIVAVLIGAAILVWVGFRDWKRDKIRRSAGL